MASTTCALFFENDLRFLEQFRAEAGPCSSVKPWLRDWVDPRWDAAQVAAGLTMAGLEVEALEPAAVVLGVVVAEVLA